MARAALCLLVVWGLPACERETAPAPANPLKDIPTAQLLERLHESSKPPAVYDELVRRGTTILPELLAALRSEDELRAIPIGDVIARIGGDAVPALRELLGSDAAHERARALEVLGLMAIGGEHARVASPDIVAALRDPSGEVRAKAARALHWLGPCDATATAALVAAVHADADWGVRMWAAKTLGDCAHGHADAERALAEALRSDDDASVRMAAADALGAMPRISEVALDALRRAEASDPVPKVKEAAAVSLVVHHQRAVAR